MIKHTGVYRLSLEVNEDSGGDLGDEDEQEAGEVLRRRRGV